MTVRPVRPVLTRKLGGLGVLTVLVIVPALFAYVGQSAAQAAVKHPAEVSISFSPGPKAGQVTAHWKTTGANTTSFKLVTALTPFSDSTKGRTQHTFTFPKSARGHVFTTTEMNAAGASLYSSNFLYGKFYSVNSTKAGTTTNLAEGKFQELQPLGKAVTGNGSVIKVAQYNVRISAATPNTGKYAWTSRLPDVAKNIVTANPDVMTLQEVSWPTQTTSLINKINATAPSARSYKYVRSGPFKRGSTKSGGTQAQRVVYDQNKYYQVGGNCNDTDAQGACTFVPRPSDDRWASYAHLAPIGHPEESFWIVSAHLNSDRTAHAEAIRKVQVDGVNTKMDALAAAGEPIIWGMDSNSWQTYPYGATTSRSALRGHGWFDTAASSNTKDRLSNRRYSTDNTKYYGKSGIKPFTVGWAPRLDLIMTKYISGSADFYIDAHPTDAFPGSDHNLVWTRIRLKTH
ncbi:MAG: hypothetical protein JWQ74_2638 [Marmoricola sp.]|nr:hypothetical protein [Marmoricola sp.]